ncbi:MAG: undecaprenyl-diphosphate phosphatase [Treponema sp.]|jgi:undecaprenyl-diphosphatase|nr:undecaprenyl-diphosphate phosphatase [Treponema sp.]
MNIFEAVILGIVQGLTEFLPVSSSGHLVLLQKIFNIKEPSLFFDTMLHLGTLTAVFVVLWSDIWTLLKKPIQPLTGYLIIATIPVVIIALLFNDTIEDVFASAKFLGFCFLITTALLVTAELLSKRAKNISDLKKAEEMRWYDALVIGIMQAVAILPGISRSGATISGALFRKLDRDFAARFSFLLSIPAILGAVVLQTKDLIKGSAAETAEVSTGAVAVIAGTITAAIVGFFAVKFMLKIIKERSLYGFAIYTAVLGCLIIFDQFVTRIVF